ncbi:MAG: hypothetical protein DIU80_006270 [Chloroflexota bacterium]
MRQPLIVTIILLAALTACGQQPAATPAGSPTEPPAATTPAAPTAAPVPTDAPETPADAYPVPPAGQAYPQPSTPTPDLGSSEGVMAELQRQARERLAQHLGVDPESLTLQQSESQEWPDTSLGCPAPDVTYAQVIIPGYRLTFSDGSETYLVHTSLSASPGEPLVFCDDGSPVNLGLPEPTPVIDESSRPAVDRAKADLAQFLNISPDEIEVIQVQPVDWNDTSLGCAQPDTTYLQVITPGYQVVLRAAGNTYTYHTDSGANVVRCTTPG